MNKNVKQLSNIRSLYREFSFSIGIQVILIVLDFLSNGIKLILAYVYLYLFDHIQTVSINQVVLIGMLTLIAVVISQGALVIYSIVHERYMQNRLLKLQSDAFISHSKSQLFFIEQYKRGKWLSLMENDTEKCVGFFGNIVIPLLRGILLFIGALLMGVIISPIMTLIVLICSMASGILMKYFQNKIFASYGEKSEGEDEVKSSLLGCVQGLETIKAYQYEEKSAQGFSKVYGEFGQKAISAAKNSNLLVSASIGSGFVISTFWMVIGIFCIFNGSMTIGAFSAFLMLSDYYNWPFFNVPKIYANAIEASVSYNRLCEFQAMKQEVYSEDYCEEVQSQLEICNVNFAYEDSETVLQDFSCQIQEGQKVALIGESGAGKSTLIKLMMGLYYPQQGEVSMIHNKKKLKGKSIQSLISYVPQVSDLFHATVADNIRFGNMEASDDEVEHAAKLAHAHDFILKLPQGYQTVVGKSGLVKLSGGQIQRIALARSLVRKTPIYVFDEVTSALDVETENKVMHNLLMMPQTMIFVAHKQSIIDACDRVIRLTK